MTDNEFRQLLSSKNDSEKLELIIYILRSMQAEIDGLKGKP